MNANNIIVDFANTNKKFNTKDLSEHLLEKIDISKKMLSWHLRKLIDEKKYLESEGVYIQQNLKPFSAQFLMPLPFGCIRN